MQARAFILWCALTLSASAATVSKMVITRSVDENSCAVPKSVAALDTSDREAFVWFRAQRLRPGEELKVEWLAPDGSVVLDAAYQDLPAAPSLCFATRLPIAGFAAAGQTGAWTVRIVSGKQTLASSSFKMNGVSGGGTLRVTSVERAVTAYGMELTVEGAGFSGLAMVHIAQYTSGSGWRYVSAAQPRVATSTQLVADYSALPPAEYLVIVRNGDGQVSRPVPFVVPTAPTGGYKLPTVAGEPWVLTQGPYGTFSHWGRTLHAYDIAPRSARCIVAMRAGIVHVHDIGAGQDHAHRTFGNYITIDHGDGEYSHYAHLATGNFRRLGGPVRGTGTGAGDGRKQRLYVGRGRRISRARASYPIACHRIAKRSVLLRRSGKHSARPSSHCFFELVLEVRLPRAGRRLAGCYGGGLVQEGNHGRSAILGKRIVQSMVEQFCFGAIEGGFIRCHAHLDRQGWRARPASDEPQRASLRVVRGSYRILRIELRRPRIPHSPPGARDMAHLSASGTRRLGADRFCDQDFREDHPSRCDEIAFV